MKKKTIPWPDVVKRNPDAVMFADEEFAEFMDDEGPDELAESIFSESLEKQWEKEMLEAEMCPKEYDPDMELKALKEREWEKKMGVCQ